MKAIILARVSTEEQMIEGQSIPTKMGTAQRITQHKRLVPCSTDPNFCFAKTSFMLETLYEMAVQYE